MVCCFFVEKVYEALLLLPQRKHEAINFTMNFYVTKICEDTQQWSETGGGCVIFARILFDIKKAHYLIHFVKITIHT